MIYTEILDDGRIHTYSDTYKIRQVETGIVYDDAVDTIHHTYEETDIPLEEVEMTDVDGNVWEPGVYGWEKYVE